MRMFARGHAGNDWYYLRHTHTHTGRTDLHVHEADSKPDTDLRSSLPGGLPLANEGTHSHTWSWCHPIEAYGPMRSL